MMRAKAFTKLVGAAVVAVVLGIGAVGCGDDGNPVGNNDGGTAKEITVTRADHEYSITPPPSWTVSEFNSMGIRGMVFTGPSDGAISPMMMVGTEQYSGSLGEYVDANIDAMKLVYNATLLRREAFQTNGGLNGEKVVFSFSLSGMSVRQMTYAFPPESGSWYASINGLGLTSYNTKYDNIFEQSAKTFKWTEVSDVDAEQERTFPQQVRGFVLGL